MVKIAVIIMIIIVIFDHENNMIVLITFWKNLILHGPLENSQKSRNKDARLEIKSNNKRMLCSRSPQNATKLVYGLRFWRCNNKFAPLGGDDTAVCTE